MCAKVQNLSYTSKFFFENYNDVFYLVFFLFVLFFLVGCKSVVPPF